MNLSKVKQMLIIERGGNASNSCTVLATLKLNPTFFGTLALGIFFLLFFLGHFVVANHCN